MIDPKADLILHPIRMRIIMTIGLDHMTAQQIAAKLADIPQATLYRHINKMVKGDLLEIVSQRQVRGTTERIYRLNTSNATLNQEELAKATPEDLMQYFTTFTVGLLGDFAAYLNTHPQPRLATDGVGFSTAPLCLSPDELATLQEGLRDLLLPYLEHQPTPQRKRMNLSMILIPSREE